MALGWRQNTAKIIASLIPVIKIVKYFGIVGGALGDTKILQNDNGAPLVLSLRDEYCGVWGGGGAPKSYKR